jgi:phosphatidylserine/phosphatidylglycerophosphate/cardiolipin synthase-like enzyme
VYYPVLPGDVAPNVHSKLLIVDDRIAYLGSANLSNRSMALDSECGLAVDGRGREDVREALAELRCRLLAEHLGSGIDTVAERTGELGLIQGIDSLRGGERTLETLETEAEEIADQLEPLARLADPQSTLDPRELVHDLIEW